MTKGKVNNMGEIEYEYNPELAKRAKQLYHIMKAPSEHDAVMTLTAADQQILVMHIDQLEGGIHKIRATLPAVENEMQRLRGLVIKLDMQVSSLKGRLRDLIKLIRRPAMEVDADLDLTKHVYTPTLSIMLVEEIWNTQGLGQEDTTVEVVGDFGD
jgi:hypothetical protein